MRSSFRILVVAAMALGVVGLAAVPGGAGGLPLNEIVVKKVVTGVVPPGTTFTVRVTCEDTDSPAPAADVPVDDFVDVTFDATGTPTSDNSITTGVFAVCTATETVTGGASGTTYACAIVQAPENEIGPPFQGNCTADNEVTLDDVLGDTATITVTNTFPTAPIQPVTPAAQAVQAAPAFTG
jgi:hypothetical protein